MMQHNATFERRMCNWRMNPQPRNRSDSGEQAGVVAPRGAKQLLRYALAAVTAALKRGTVAAHGDATIVPLQVGDLMLGVLYLKQPATTELESELFSVFANQATVAIQNMQLYEMAALDPLTGVHARRFFEIWMRREVRTAFRSCQPVSMLIFVIPSAV